METLTNTLETINKGRWQWRSNSNPWSKTEPPQWQSYSLEHNYLIEKAYYDREKEVDLGDYLVYPLEMMQRKKGNPHAQRPIKRVNWVEDEEINDRSARYFETELPKTINRIFGDLGDFISFFSRRNQEILDLMNSFKDLEQSNDLDILNNRILPKLVNCLEEALMKPNLERLQDSSLSHLKKKLLLKISKQTEELICLFGNKFSNVEEFYGNILKAYTMETDLYPNLNKYLRNESWVEMDKLLPYAFCLFKTFFHFRLKRNLVQEQEPKIISSITFYRGTAFNESDLRSYDLERIKDFSWNSVTSTSTSEKMAEDFMYKASNLAEKIYPVMFIIEVPLVTESDTEYLKWIDIHQFSVIPKEGEVVLAPGSVFELIEVSTDQEHKTTIKIKLRNEIKSLAYGGMMMQGTLQNQLMTETEARMMCLEGKELLQALTSLCGNKLIEEVEFCLCTFNKDSLFQMFEVLPTLNQVKILKFIACIYEGNRNVAIEGLDCKGITKIEVIETENFFQRICNERQDQKYWTALREFDLDFRSRQSLTDKELDCAVSQGLKYLTQVRYLKMNFESCRQITNEGMESLAKGLNSLTQLAHLDLSFRLCEQITDERVNILTKSLSSFNQGTHLNISFERCKQITDKGVKNLAQGLNSLTHLTSLDINFKMCAQIMDQGVYNLAQGLSSFTQLRWRLTSTPKYRISNEAMLNLR